MKYFLNDGSVAHLVAIIQNRNYQIGYRQTPSNAAEEILRIARGHVPKDYWGEAPFLLIGHEPESLNSLLRSRKLPGVLCVGLFYSIRGGVGKEGTAIYLCLVWLQEDLLPYMSPENQSAFEKIEWPEKK